MPEASGGGVSRIVVGVDGSDHARRALRFAIDEARLRGATVEAIHAWHHVYLGASGFTALASPVEGIEEAARATLDHTVDSEPAEGVEVARKLVMGPAAPALLDAAEGADLVVVGSRGHGGFAGLLLGSVSQQVAHHAPCPVIIVPGEH